jgi:hypothetical protein
MGDLSTYSLSDFFPFTPEVYFRLFVRHNEAVWPLQIVAILLAFLAIWQVWRGRGRPVAVVLAACWAFVGYKFHIDLYANLNWAARYFGWAFIAQGALVLGSGLLGRLDREPDKPLGGPEWMGLGIALFAVLIFGLLGPLAGPEGAASQWTGVEIFGIAPDPTVIATFGLVLMAGRTRWLLFVIPVLWAAISGATAWVMEAPVGFVTPAAALLALAIGIWKSVSLRTSRPMSQAD